MDPTDCGPSQGILAPDDWFDTSQLQKMFDSLQVYSEWSTSKAPRKIKMQKKGGRSSWCSFLTVIGPLSCLRVVGASSASATGSSVHSALDYVVIAATVLGTLGTVTGIGLGIYYHRRGRGGGGRGSERSVKGLEFISPV